MEVLGTSTRGLLSVHPPAQHPAGHLLCNLHYTKCWVYGNEEDTQDLSFQGICKRGYRRQTRKQVGKAIADPDKSEGESRASWNEKLMGEPLWTESPGKPTLRSSYQPQRWAAAWIRRKCIFSMGAAHTAPAMWGPIYDFLELKGDGSGDSGRQWHERRWERCSGTRSYRTRGPQISILHFSLNAI